MYVMLMLQLVRNRFRKSRIASRILSRGLCVNISEQLVGIGSVVVKW